MRKNGKRMAKRGENRFWEAFCPLHMHAITQAAMQARPQVAIPRPTPRFHSIPEGHHVMYTVYMDCFVASLDLIYTTPQVMYMY